MDEIYVYKPSFPSQVLPTSPETILTLPASQPSLLGYIDIRHPHAVNNLLVADLGEEEIIACVCDDGDVLAYHTRAVSNAVERRSTLDAIGYSDDYSPKPFFNENVGLSAWGLAVHKAGRMIAVSANTHEITVFAFALSPENAGSEDDELTHTRNEPLGHSTWISDSERLQAISPSERTDNLRIVLRGHRNNVPNIALCNTDQDREGRWLVSTDIDGEMLVWDIWSRKELKQHQFAAPIAHSSSPVVFNSRVGWVSSLRL